MHILFAASECFPFVKIGGLADVVGGLPKALAQENADVSIVIPHYSELKIEGIIIKREILKFPVEYDKTNQEVVVNQVFLPNSNVPVYLLENKNYLSNGGIYTNQELHPEQEIDRFVFFSKAVVFFLKFSDWQSPHPIDIVHCHDWHTSLIPLLLKKYLPTKNIKTLLTIHNLGKAYQGVSDKKIFNKLDVEENLFTLKSHEKKVNILRQGIVISDLVSTVSKTYAAEIQTAKAGEGLDKYLSEKKTIYGILNGIDYDIWDPKKDKNLVANYASLSSRESEARNDNIVDWQAGKKRNKSRLLEIAELPQGENVSTFGMVTRIAEQKGFEILIPVLETLFAKQDSRVVILGVGDPRLESRISDLELKYRDKLRFITRFDEVLAHLIYAGSDFFLIPSRFEPSGLGQLIAMRYGTLPIVRKTGGLADSVLNGETGFIFNEYTVAAFQKSIDEAVLVYQKDKEKYSRMVENALACDFSWTKSAREYLKLYEKLD